MSDSTLSGAAAVRAGVRRGLAMRDHARSVPIGIDELLAEARSELARVSAHEAAAALERGAAVIDIRSESQRERDGLIPGAVYVPRNILEWRTDP